MLQRFCCTAVVLLLGAAAERGNESCTSDTAIATDNVNNDDEAEEIKASLVQLRSRSQSYTIAEDYVNSSLIPSEFVELHPIESSEDHQAEITELLQTESPPGAEVSVVGGILGQWVDLGAGCCQNNVKPRFNGRVANSKECIAKAELLFGGYILYGWPGSTWCTVYPREYNCGKSATRATDPGSCSLGPGAGAVGGGTGVHTLQLFSFMDLGKGCCTPNPGIKVVFNGNMRYDNGKPGDLRACLQMCEWQHFDDCGYVMFGFSKAPTWCTVYTKDTVCSSLDQGVCNSGVHTYHFLSNCGKCDVKK